MADELDRVVGEIEDVTEAELRLCLDDDVLDRRPPYGWVQVTTAHRAITLLESGWVVELSLDHDLGDDERFGRGVDVCDWLAEQAFAHQRPLWPRDGITLHTANPGGRDAMAHTIERYATGQIHRDITSGGKPRFRFEAPRGESQ